MTSHRTKKLSDRQEEILTSALAMARIIGRAYAAHAAVDVDAPHMTLRLASSIVDGMGLGLLRTLVMSELERSYGDSYNECLAAEHAKWPGGA